MASKSGLNPASVWVNTVLSQLTLQQKIGQLLHPFLRTHLGVDAALEDLDGIEVGGAFLFPAQKETLQQLSSKLQNRHQVPVVVASDLENGAGRMIQDAITFPDNMGVAATHQPEFAYALGEAAAKEGRECGIHWSFGPVVDINVNPHNPITNTRSFGDQPQTIAQFAQQMINGMQQNGMAACAKHFPGDGFDDRDQHLCTTINPLSMEEWRASSGRLFQQMIDNGVWTIMIGHIALPAYHAHDSGLLHKAPSAVLSHKLTTQLLREEMGFDGLIISDAIGMGGSCTQYPEMEVVVRSIEAGCDMVLFCQTRPSFDAILNAVQTGRLSETRIDESVRRILALKEKLGLSVNLDMPAIAQADKDRLQQTSQLMAQKALTLLRNAPRQPLKAGMKVLSLHFRGDPQYNVDAIDTLLKERGIDVTRYTELDEWAMQQWGDATRFDAILIHTVFGPSWATNRIRMAGNFNRSIIEAIKTHHSLLFFTSFGNPYQLYEYPLLPWYLNAYSNDIATQTAYVKLLFGELTATGQSPVDVEKLLR